MTVAPLRIKPGLQGLVDNQPAAAPYQEEVASVPGCRGRGAGRRLAGVGWSTFRESSSMARCRRAEPYFTIGPAFWKRPKNWKQLVDAVEWSSQGDVPLQVEGPEFLAANLVEQADKRRRLVHLVNYNTGQIPSIENIEVKCVLPEGVSAQRGTALLR